MIEYDRGALIAYMYDVYCIEQAIVQTNNGISYLYNELKRIPSELNNELSKLDNENKKAISFTESQFEQKQFDGKGEHGITGISLLSIPFFILSFIIYRFSDRVGSIMLISAFLFIIIEILISIGFYFYTKAKKSNGINKYNREQHQRIKSNIDSINALHYKEIEKIKNKYKYKEEETKERIQNQNDQLEELKKLKSSIYNNLLLKSHCFATLHIPAKNTQNRTIQRITANLPSVI